MPLNVLGVSFSLDLPAEAAASRAEGIATAFSRLYEALWQAGVRDAPTRFDTSEVWVRFYLAQAATIERLQQALQSSQLAQALATGDKYRLQARLAVLENAEQTIEALQLANSQKADSIKLLEADLEVLQSALSQMQAELEHVSRLLVLNQEQINALAGGAQPKNPAK